MRAHDNINFMYLQIQDIPTVTWAAEDGAFYTIIMTGETLAAYVMYVHSLVVLNGYLEIDTVSVH